MKKTLILVLASAMLAAAGDVAVELEAAIRRETVQGDLKGAAEAYRKIAANAGGNREVGARALLRLALVYRKLGDAQARQALERLVRDFSDQKDVAAQARAMLAALGGTPGGVRTRLVWDQAIDLWGTVSADGRYVSFVNWPTLSPDIHDLATGENLRLWEKGGPEKGKGETGANAISPDGKRVAFAYLPYGEQRGYDELHIINSDGSGHKVLVSRPEFDYIEPHSWSADGKWIACMVKYKDGRQAIVLVSAADGQTRIVPTETQAWKSRVVFSPDGKWIAYTLQSNNTPSPLYVTPAEAKVPSAVRLLDDAQAMGWTPDGSGILFSRARAGAHHLFVLPVAQGKAAGEAQALYTSSDVGKMPFGVAANGTLFFGTYNRRADAAIYEWNGNAAALKEPKVSFPTTSSMGWLLTGDAVQYSRDGKRIAAVAPSGGFIVRDLSSGAEQTVTPALAEWRFFQWGSESDSLLILGGAEGGKSGVYRVGLAGEPMVFVTELPAGIRNFASSPDGRTIYYGRFGEIRARDVAQGSDRLLWDRAKGGPFQIKLSKDGKKLAVRAGQYLGVIDPASGNVLDIQTAEGNVNLAKPFWSLEWSADDSQLLTIVKLGMGDDKLEFWVFPAAGGAPVKQGNVSSFRGLSLSPDGKRLATARFSQRWQVWALENFLPAKK